MREDRALAICIAEIAAGSPERRNNRWQSKAFFAISM